MRGQNLEKENKINVGYQGKENFNQILNRVFRFGNLKKI